MNAHTPYVFVLGVLIGMTIGAVIGYVVALPVLLEDQRVVSMFIGGEQEKEEKS